MKDVIELLEFLNIWYKSCHWLVEKNYADHLLYDRLHEKISDEIDSLMELSIANGVIFAKASDRINALKETMSGVESINGTDNFLTSLKLEEELINSASNIMRNEALSVGMQNALANICENHEKNIYLLIQRA